MLDCAPGRPGDPAHDGDRQARQGQPEQGVEEERPHRARTSTTIQPIRARPPTTVVTGATCKRCSKMAISAHLPQRPGPDWIAGRWTMPGGTGRGTNEDYHYWPPAAGE